MQLVLEKRAERSNTIALVSPLIAIGLTIVTMSILFVILGKNPVSALIVYFIDPLTDAYSLQEIAVKASPLVMIAIGLSLCYLANAWNIGAEGQFLIGAVAGSWIAVKTQGTDAGYWVLPAMLVLAASAGALYALIPAICKVRFGASEILTSLMLVYVADLVLDYLVRGPCRHHRGCRTRRAPAARHFARLRFYRDHRRVSRPAEPNWNTNCRPFPRTHLHRRRTGPDCNEDSVGRHQGVSGHPAVLRARLRFPHPLPLPARFRVTAGVQWNWLRRLSFRCWRHRRRC